MLVPAEELRALAEGILCANGVPPAHAKIQAGLFVEAELRGVPSHGLLRLRRVIERIKAGLSVPGGGAARRSGRRGRFSAWMAIAALALWWRWRRWTQSCRAPGKTA
jgi:LDH2 family malate/lactate/ureidoglycolate dehydrogenase